MSYCQKCGTKFKPTETFCPKCGVRTKTNIFKIVSFLIGWVIGIIIIVRLIYEYGNKSPRVTGVTPTGGLFGGMLITESRSIYDIVFPIGFPSLIISGILFLFLRKKLTLHDNLLYCVSLFILLTIFGLFLYILKT